MKVYEIRVKGDQLLYETEAWQDLHKLAALQIDAGKLFHDDVLSAAGNALVQLLVDLGEVEVEDGLEHEEEEMRESNDENQS